MVRPEGTVSGDGICAAKSSAGSSGVQEDPARDITWGAFAPAGVEVGPRGLTTWTDPKRRFASLIGASRSESSEMTTADS